MAVVPDLRRRIRSSAFLDDTQKSQIRLPWGTMFLRLYGLAQPTAEG